MSLQVDEGWVRDYCRRTGTRLPEGMDLPREDKPRENKYQNIPTMEDGKVYPSRREAGRHRELKLLQEAGEIRGWAEQVTFLLPGGIRYRADFVVLYPDGHYEVEDAKGMRTKEYLLKRKLMAGMGIEIREV